MKTDGQRECYKKMKQDQPGKKEVERWKRRELVVENWVENGIKHIKKKIRDNELNRWREGVEGRSSLKWYKRKQRPEGVTWHIGDWGSKLLYKAWTGTLELNGRNRDVENQSCTCTTWEKRNSRTCDSGMQQL